MKIWDSVYICHCGITVKGPPHDFKGKTLLLLTVVLVREIRFLPTKPLLGGGIPPRNGIN